MRPVRWCVGHGDHPRTEPDEVGGTDWETIRRFGRRLVFSEPATPDSYEVYGSAEEAHTEFVFRLKNMIAMAAEAAAEAAAEGA